MTTAHSRCFPAGALLLCLLLIVTVAGASRMPPPPVEPGTFVSPSGEWELYVDPSDSDGRGAGHYTMSRGSAEVWSREHPWTLVKPRVTDAGEVVGYAYDQGIMGHGIRPRNEEAPHGHVVLVILNADGSVRLEHQVVREFANYFHADPSPTLLDLDVSEADDLVIYLLRHYTGNRNDWAIHLYRLSNANQIDQVQIDGSGPRAARLLPGATVFAAPHRVQHEGTWLDAWALRSLGDGSMVAYFPPEASSDLTTPVPEDAHRVTFPSSGRQPVHREHFFALDDDGNYHHWIGDIVDTTRGATTVSLESIPVVELEHLGTISLRDPDNEARAGFAYRDFHFDAEGLIHAVFSSDYTVDEADSIRVVRVMTQEGELISETPFHGGFARDPIISPIGGTEVLLRTSLPDTFRSGTILRLDLETGEYGLLSIEHDDITAAVRVEDGLVVLAGLHSQYSRQQELLRYDAAGEVVWRIEHAGRREHDKIHGSSAAIALSPNGEIGLLNTAGKFIQVFDGNGQWVRSIGLADVMGREANYPTGIAAAKDGWLVRDFNGIVPWVWISADGTKARDIDLRLENGVPFAGILRESPQGELWVADGERLMRLDADARIAESLGPKPSVDGPTNIEKIAVGPGPFIHALDAQTRHVFSYTLDGEPIAVMRPDPDDFPMRVRSYDIEISADSEGVLSMHSRSLGNSRLGPLQFLPDGTRLGWTPMVEEASSIRSATFHATPDGDGGWLRTFGQVTRVHADGEVSVLVNRSAANQWLSTSLALAIAPDGSIAVSDQHGVSIYHPSGEARAHIPISDTIRRIAIRNDTLVVATYQRHDDPRVVGYDLNGRPLWRTVVPGTDAYPSPYFPPQRDDEVWFRHRGLEVQRYALP